MDLEKFSKENFKEDKTFKETLNKYSSGQVTIIGGSKLFHGAPILALKGASRIVSMTFFASLEEDDTFVKNIKGALGSFVWIPKQDISSYIEKSDAVLIGPGLMRSHTSKMEYVCDEEGAKTRDLTISLFRKFPNKKWIVDGGSLQVISVDELPPKAVITPNHKEFVLLFKENLKTDLSERCEQVRKFAKNHDLVILTKDEVSVASDGLRVVLIEGGNNGLVKGGVGDVIAGVALGFLAKNNGLFSVAAASYLVKKAAEKLASESNLMFNSDDLVDMVPKVYMEVAADL